MTTSDCLCFIPAKGTSTRLHKKNIQKINGKELIYYPIHAAQKSKIFGEHIYLSTESEEIKQIALKYGAKVPYLREKTLSYDPYRIVDVALDFFEKQPHLKTIKYIFFLLPTAPLTQAEDILKSFDIFKVGGIKSLMSITETEHNAYRAVTLNNGILQAINTEGINKKSQELPTTYMINGAICIMKIDDFLFHRNYLVPPIGTYIIPRNRSVDIDTEDDLAYARYLFERKK